MLVDIESFFLYTCRNSQAMNDIQSLEHHESHEGRPAAYHQGPEYLGHQEVCASAVEQALSGSEQSGEDRTQASANAVYGGGADRIVDL